MADLTAAPEASVCGFGGYESKFNLCEDVW